jgi:hypothetical protein
MLSYYDVDVTIEFSTRRDTPCTEPKVPHLRVCNTSFWATPDRVKGGDIFCVRNMSSRRAVFTRMG